MNLTKYLFFLIIVFLFACKNDNKSKPAATYQATFKETPTQFSGNKEQAYQKLNNSLDELIKNRTADGKMSQANNPTVVAHTLGILQQFSNEDESLLISFRAAELLAASEDYENAAKLFKLITTTFPKNEKVGHAMIQLGLILDKQLDNKPAAVEIYRSFLKNYQNHPFEGTAEGLLYELVRYDQQQ